MLASWELSAAMLLLELARVLPQALGAAAAAAAAAVDVDVCRLLLVLVLRSSPELLRSAAGR